MGDAPGPPWDLLNPEQIRTWMERFGPEFDEIKEVIDVIEAVLTTPDYGLKMTIVGGNPVYHALTQSGRISVTWSFLDERIGAPRGVYIRQIETFGEEPIY